MQTVQGMSSFNRLEFDYFVNCYEKHPNKNYQTKISIYKESNLNTGNKLSRKKEKQF